MKKSIPFLIASIFSFPVLADISVHVLDTNYGQPAPYINVDLYQKNDAGWDFIGRQVTDKKGRIARFDFNDKNQNPYFRAIFHVGDYFKKQKIDSFYDNIPIDFVVKDTKQHYHIPLLLSPFAYSTYRGN